MTRPRDFSDAELLTHHRDCSAVVNSLIESLESRPDMQDAIRRLMSLDDMLQTLDAIRAEDADLARLILQASVAALVNVQSVKGIEAEIARREAGMN